jgi:uncharacterized protein (DUF2141 family)
MVTQRKFCENCGAPLAEDANFCESCGSRIAASTPVPMTKDPPKAVAQAHTPPPAKPASWKGTVWKIVSLALIVVLSAAALSFFHLTETPLSNPASLQSKSLPDAKSYAISGKVYNDVNGDGSIGSSESGLSGWTIKLDRPDRTSTTAITGYDGSYRFDNLPPGVYLVSELQQSGWSPTTYASFKVTISSYDVGDVSIGNRADAAKKVQVPPTTAPLALTYSISGKVFNDVNGDGVRSSDDAGLSGWTISLTGPDGTSKTETTLYDGSYLFKGLSPGIYTVSEVLQYGWAATSPASRSATISSSDEKGINFWNTGPGETVPANEESEEMSPTSQRILYSDDFSDSNSGWATESSNPDTGSVGYKNGKYYITVLNENIDKSSWLVRSFSDFELEVEAAEEGGPDDNDYGVILRLQDKDNYYRFRITGDGYYDFSKQEDEKWSDIIPWTQSNAINIGRATNLIRAECNGDKFTFYVNGIKLGDCTDNSYASGCIGLVAGTFEDSGVQIGFDNLKVWAI